MQASKSPFPQSLIGGIWIVCCRYSRSSIPQCSQNQSLVESIAHSVTLSNEGAYTGSPISALSELRLGSSHVEKEGIHDLPGRQTDSRVKERSSTLTGGAKMLGRNTRSSSAVVSAGSKRDGRSNEPHGVVVGSEGKLQIVISDYTPYTGRYERMRDWVHRVFN